MTTLNDIFDVDAFWQQVDEGYIAVKAHPEDENLWIADYTPKQQFRGKWTLEALNSRGLIFEKNSGKILARPFEKFFNFDEPSAKNPPPGVMIKSPKMDGSLGIIYPFQGGFAVATRGSFRSDQAVHATARLQEYLADGSVSQERLENLYSWGYTVLVEIVYPENRIVVNYGDIDELILLDVIEVPTGGSDIAMFSTLDYEGWPLSAEKQVIGTGFYDTIASEIAEDEEGFVLYWPAKNLRLKVKGATYVHLHRIMTNMSARDIWRFLAVNGCKEFVEKDNDWATQLQEDPKKCLEALKAGDDWLVPFITDVPDEFYGWIKNTIFRLKQEKRVVYTELRERAESLKLVEAGRSRYELSRQFEHGGIILNAANTTGDMDKILVPYAWKQIFPGRELPFAGVDGE
mgnify:CR=1 FL=1